VYEHCSVLRNREISGTENEKGGRGTGWNEHIVKNINMIKVALE